MPLNILDLQDIKLGAARKVKAKMEELQFRFYQPLIDTQLNMALGAIAKKVDPKAAKQLDDLFGGGKNDQG